MRAVEPCFVGVIKWEGEGSDSLGGQCEKGQYAEDGIDCGRKAGARLPVGEPVLHHLHQARQFSAAEGKELNSSSLYGVVRREAGLAFETELVETRDASLRQVGVKKSDLSVSILGVYGPSWSRSSL